MNGAICANPACDKTIDLASPHVTISRSVEVEVGGTVTVAASEVLRHHHLGCFEREIARARAALEVYRTNNAGFDAGEQAALDRDEQLENAVALAELRAGR